MEITANFAKRIKADWQEMAKEAIDLQVISGTPYAFCSEIAALRIANKYPKQIFEGKAKAAYSENRKTWFFRLEI